VWAVLDVLPADGQPLLDGGAGGGTTHHDHNGILFQLPAGVRLVPVSQVFRSDGDLDGPGFPRSKEDAIKAFQFLAGSGNGGADVAHVKLDHFGAASRTSIRDIHSDRDRRVLGQAGRTESQIRIRERGVAQAVTKRIQRFGRGVHIRSALAEVIVFNRRQLSDRLRPRLRQTTAWIVVAEDHVGNGIPLFLRSVGGPKNGGNVLLCPIDRVRKAGNQNDDGPAIGRENFLDQRFFGEVQRRAITAFPTFTSILAGLGGIIVIHHWAHLGHIAAERVIADDDDGNIAGLGRV
jgi:hypothetical protein